MAIYQNCYYNLKEYTTKNKSATHRRKVRLQNLQSSHIHKLCYSTFRSHHNSSEYILWKYILDGLMYDPIAMRKPFQYPISINKVDIHCTNLVNVQYPISMYKVDIRCTNLWEWPTSNIDKQGRHSLYIPTGMSNIQYRRTG